MPSKRLIAQTNLHQILAEYAGNRLPPERELATRLHVSRTLLRNLLNELAASGRLERRRGSGNYVIDRTEATCPPTVALLVDERLKLGDDPYFTRCIERLQAALQQRGSRCQLERIDGRRKPEINSQGVITLGLAGEAVLKAWRPQDPPLVALFINRSPRPGTRASVIKLENTEAGQEAARRLLASGIRHVFLIGLEAIPDSRSRMQSAAFALGEAGCILERIDCGMNYLDGFNLGRSLDPTRVTKKTALLVTNDWCAVGVRAGLAFQQTPELWKTPIASFDGLEIAADPSLGIESMAVPIVEIIHDALDELQRLHTHPQLPGRVLCYPLR